MKALGLITQIETISRGMPTSMLRVQQGKKKQGTKKQIESCTPTPNGIKPNKSNYKRQKRLYGDNGGIDIYQTADRASHELGQIEEDVRGIRGPVSAPCFAEHQTRELLAATECAYGEASGAQLRAPPILEKELGLS